MRWDVTTGKEQEMSRACQGAVVRLVFSPDSKVLASVNKKWAIQLWDVPRASG
jgi:hypothetical protein